MVPRIKFDTLVTIDDWSGALRKIIDAAVAATANKDARTRQELQDLLLVYIKKSPAKVELLDVIAREAVEDLALVEIGVSLERIASRSAELERAVDLIAAVTAEAGKSARALQLERTIDALTAARAAVDALSRLERALASPDEDLLQKLKASADAIGTVAKAIQAQ